MHTHQFISIKTLEQFENGRVSLEGKLVVCAICGLTNEVWADSTLIEKHNPNGIATGTK